MAPFGVPFYFNSPEVPLREQQLREGIGRFKSFSDVDIKNNSNFYNFSDKYFVRTGEILKMKDLDPYVTMQVFAKKKGVFAGAYEAISQFERIHPSAKNKIRIRTLLDGDEVSPWETVMLIDGPYREFAFLETTYLGVLARRSLVATNARAVAEAARDKTVIFMGARHDDWRVQVGDGYAAHLGGIPAASTDANCRWTEGQGVGTMPHALIAAFKGDVVAATLAFAEYIQHTGQNIPILSLVDFNNDVIGDSIAVCQALRKRFNKLPHAVRVDTSEKLVDKSLIDSKYWGRETVTGVNVPMIFMLREALDKAGFESVGIVASGGFTPTKIRKFEEVGAPVIGYGVGSSILGHNDNEGGLLSGFDFTADIVQVENSPVSKVGRKYSFNERLVEVKW